MSQPTVPNSTNTKKKLRVSELISHIPNKKIAVQFFQNLGKYNIFIIRRVFTYLSSI
jgi:hypothetical protein